MNTGILAADALFNFQEFKHFGTIVKVKDYCSELFIDKVLVAKFNKTSLTIYDLTTLYQISIINELLSLFSLRLENIEGKLIIFKVNTTFFTVNKETSEKTFYMNFSEIVGKELTNEGLKENQITIGGN